MSFRLVPREENFFDLFEELAGHCGDAARLLKIILAHPADAEENHRLLKRVEDLADTCVREVFTRLGKTFNVPLDREDIPAIAQRLDDIVDGIESVGLRVSILAKHLGGSLDHFAPLLPQTFGLVQTLIDATVELPEALKVLRRPHRATIEKYSKTIHLLENKGDALWEGEGGVLDIFAGCLAKDLTAPATKGDMLLAVWQELCHAIERTIDLVKNTADCVSSVVDKFD